MEIPKVIKFKNGDLVIAQVFDSVDDLYRIENPIAAVTFPTMQGEIVGETFLLKPWIGISQDKSFFVRKSDILTVCTLKENLLEQYKNYLLPNEEQPSEPEDDQFGIDEVVQAMVLKSKNLLN